MNPIEITVSELQDMMSLPEKQEDLVTAWIDLISHGFIFDYFVLKINEMEQTYKVRLEDTGDNQIIHIKKIQKDNGIAIKTVSYDINAFDYLKKFTEFLLTSKKIKSIKELYKSTDDELLDVVAPMSFMQYIMIQGRNRKIEFIEPKERTGNSKGSYSRSDKKKTYHLLDCIKIYQTKNKNRKEYEYRVESFPRRGGFRRLKSGKIVPYSPTTVHPKNKGDDKPNDNRYTL